MLTRRRVVFGLLGCAAVLFAYQTLRGERVVVVTAERGELRQAVVASGRVRTPQRVDVAAQITGTIKTLRVREGDLITPGQPLIDFEAAEWQASVAQARASLRQAENRLQQIAATSLPLAEQTLRQAEATTQQAERHFKRVSELVAKGFYSTAQLDDAQRSRDIAASQLQAARVQVANTQPAGSETRVAQSTVEQARATLALAEARLAYAALRAPVAGRVLTRHVEAGDTAQPGKVLLTLAPAGPSELTAQIDEKNLSLLALGQKARVSSDAYPQAQFPAELTFIAPAIDAQRGSIEIRLTVPTPPAYLKHEMTVSIDIETARRADSLNIACDSLRDLGAAPWVMLVRDGKTQRQPVKLGLRGAGRCEILEGLSPNDRVLLASNAIAEGRRVSTVDRK